MRIALLATFALLAGLPVAASQTQEGLVLSTPACAGPITVAGTTCTIGWSYQFSDQVRAAAALGDGKATLHWALDCAGSFQMVEVDTTVPYTPGASSSSGNATLTFRAEPATPGLRPIPCKMPIVLHTTADQPIPAQPTSEQISLVAAYVPGIKVTTAQLDQTAGPEKVIRYDVSVENTGNARTQVGFSLEQKPHGKWNAILPEVLLLDIGENRTATFAVATPFQDGPNSGSASYVLLLTPTSADDRTQGGVPVEVELHAHVHGMYVPAPGVLFALAAVAVALAARRAHCG